MNVTLVSAFRNSFSYINRYCEQMESLQELLRKSGHTLHLVLGYGDSEDGTGEILYEEVSHRFSASLLDVSHGGLHYGSVVNKQRFKQLAFVGNKLWSAIPLDSHVVGLVESDLIWQPQCLSNLIEATRSVDMIAPMVMHLDGRFYDTWAFRMDGMRFTNEPVFHPQLLTGASLYEMDSVGSVFLMKTSIARQVSWPEEDVVVGLCKQVRDLGYDIYLDKTLEVYHP
jgi:hypothetical protein